ncbi:MAG: SOS response-associated peptidase family protein [Inhella sp.]
MCYSAQVEARYKAYHRRFGARMSLQQYAERVRDLRFLYPRALERDFDPPHNAEEAAIAALIAERHAAQAAQLEELLFSQRSRLVDAERALAAKPSKTASDSARIARNKIAWAGDKLRELRRREPEPGDARIYPGWYCPVLVIENGEPRVHLMRYQCRPAGKPLTFDQRFPGTYNARRDNLKKFWRAQYGSSHGLVLAKAFYEHVQTADGRRAVLEFRPQGWQQDMGVACLWSRWRGPEGAELLSFAAITDEPPPEVAAAGHDRCIVPLKEANWEAWLSPQGRGDAALDALLDDRERPFYEHRLAA